MSPDFPDTFFDNPRFVGEDPVPIPLRMSEEALHDQLLYINYYRNLEPEMQQEFRSRVREFIENKIILGINKIKLPDNARAFIAASAIQLTFGLKEWWYYHFHTIRIYPKEFYSRVNEKYLKGGAGQNGVVFFSWKDYLAGYADQENGINLGLHEMAHALMINMQHGAQSPEFHASFQRLIEIERDLLEKVCNGQISFLRKYAGANINEFFAVSIEHFFEQPMEFKKLLPILYWALADLLQQDPAAKRVGPEPKQERIPVAKEFSSSEPTLITYDEEPAKKKFKKEKEEKSPRNFRFARWHWSLTVLLAGIFGTPLALGYLCYVTYAPPGIFWLIYFAFVIAGSIYYYRRIVPTEALNLTQFIFFIALGIGPLGLTGTLLVNHMIPVHKESENYRLTGTLIYQPGGAIVDLENKAHYDEPELRKIPLKEMPLVKKGATLHIRFYRGIFGMLYYQGSGIAE